jgi:hypothetical protein
LMERPAAEASTPEMSAMMRKFGMKVYMVL